MKWVRSKVGDKVFKVPDKIFRERRVPNVASLMDTAEERVRKQLSHSINHPKVLYPLHRKDDSTQRVQTLARDMLLKQRARAAATFTDKNGIPMLQPMNGVGHFVLPLQRLHLSYCSHYGDSAGFRDFMRLHLTQLARKYPSVEFVVEPRWSRSPVMRAYYLNDYSKDICVRNRSAQECMEVFEQLVNASGKKLRPFHQKVESKTPALRPIWSPFSSTPTLKNNPLQKYTFHK